VLRVDCEEPQIDVLVLGVAAFLDGGESQSPGDRPWPGGDEAWDEVDERPLRRRIEAGGEGGGDALEPAIVERAVDGPAVLLDDVESGAVIAPENPVPPGRPVRPNGSPARIVQKRVGKDRRGRIEIRAIEGANFHARDLPLPDAHTPRAR
jgi:hypothetical protein